MTHDFVTATVELHGVTQTRRIEEPFGDKNLDILCRLFAQSVDKGVMDPSLPKVKDAVIASEYAWKFLEDAIKNDLPSRGTLKTLQAIRERRNTQRIGYGLLRKKK